MRRLTWLAAAIVIWAGLILARILFLQVVEHDEYTRLARQQQLKLVEIPAPRGTIFDRTGQPMAMSIPMDSVFINPRQIPDLKIAAEILSSILQLDRATLYGRMKWAMDNRRGFMWVERKITSEVAAKLRSLKLDWIQFETESQRHYPGGPIAAHVLGSVDYREKGNWGIELSLNRVLEGHAGAARMLTDVKRRGIDSHLSEEARPGESITLTIDERIQFTAEQELAKAVRESRANTGSVVVMNPRNGEILAMASYPSFDPNKPPAPGENASNRINHAVSVPFEPGSVFKVITLSAALESTSLRPDSIINCGNGALTIFGRTIHEAHHGYGSIPMSMVLAKSSNIGAIQVGLRVGQERLYEYVRSFGFGSRTGLRLPAESPGLVRKLTRWGKTSLPSVAMGHEISTTTLQLAQACSVVANGGLLMPPKLLLRRGGNVATSGPSRRVLRPETAIMMRKMMEGVVLVGTGRRARLDGYSSGGKTGSAQIFDFAARHYTHTYNSSFMGFAPVANPAIVVVVTVNGTHGSAGFGGVVAAPVFKAVAQEALRVLDVPKDLPEEEPAPDKPGKPAVEDGDDLAISELADPAAVEEELAGETDSGPQPPGTGEPAQPAGPKVPNFRGMSVRAVIAEASQRGLPVLVDGSGVARLQQPLPGAVLAEGEHIRVQFSR